MNTATDHMPSNPNAAFRRIGIVCCAAVLPFLLAVTLSGLFHLFGDYKVTCIKGFTSQACKSATYTVTAKTAFGSITYPEHNTPVEQAFIAKGSIKKLPKDTTAYLMVKRDDLYWPKKDLGDGIGAWSQEIKEDKRKNSRLYLVVLALNPADKQKVEQWHDTSKQTNQYPGIAEFSAEQEIIAVEVKQQ